MSEPKPLSRLPKLPFYFANLVLAAIAAYVLYRLGTFDGPWEFGLVAGALLIAAFGAWISVIPWLADHKAELKLADSSNLASSLQQFRGIESVAEEIRRATSQWQGVHESSAKTLQAAGEISERMKAEAAGFMKFMEKANDQERAHLRLEVEKMKRSEGDWLKVLVQIMDHVHALTLAGERSGQPSLISQLQQFQSSCRDVARRVGVVPYIPALGEPFDERGHQLMDPNFKPPAEAKVGEVLATGFMYQGQLLRRALVLLANPEETSTLAPSQPGEPVEPPESGPEDEPLQPADVSPEDPVEQKGWEEPGETTQAEPPAEPAPENAPGEAPQPSTPKPSPSPEPPEKDRGPEQLRLV